MKNAENPIVDPDFFEEPPHQTLIPVSEEELKKEEDREDSWEDAYPDDDMEDNRLPSERFYHPDDRIPLDSDEEE